MRPGAPDLRDSVLVEPSGTAVLGGDASLGTASGDAASAVTADVDRGRRWARLGKDYTGILLVVVGCAASAAVPGYIAFRLVKFLLLP